MNARTTVVDGLFCQSDVITISQVSLSDLGDSIRFAFCAPPLRVEPGQKRMVIGWVAASHECSSRKKQRLDLHLSLLPRRTPPIQSVTSRGAQSQGIAMFAGENADGGQESIRPGFAFGSQDANQALTDLLEPSSQTISPRASLPISIRTLGCFEVRMGGQSLVSKGKIQRKPITLLKALIALGGINVPSSKLIDIVWAVRSSGDPQSSFDIALHRLRKLLGQREAIQLSDRRVSLNRKMVWLDLWELEREFDSVIPLGRSCVPAAEALERAAPVILNLYRGRFLPGEAEASWLLPLQNRLHGRFHSFIMRLGDHWEALAEWQRAADLLERAIEVEPLTEVFYCRLMVCLRAQGRRAEAIDVFRRCRQLLSVTQGTSPGPTTAAVYRDLRSV